MLFGLAEENRHRVLNEKTMKVPSRKRTARNPSKVPLWLRRLDQVKAELKATRFPRTAEEGFCQCVILSTTALRLFQDSIRASHLGAIERRLESEMRFLLARLSSAQACGS